MHTGALITLYVQRAGIVDGGKLSFGDDFRSARIGSVQLWVTTHTRVRDLWPLSGLQ